ncbi:MAG: glutamate racemase [Spirochaetia bacterium]|nr:glutamate racemase [Spirochaetia bacterium]
MGKIAGFYDSGIGGLPYLKWIREHSSGLTFRYLAESRYFPFGTKDEAAIREIVLDSIGRFIDRVSPDIIVIACNTASVTALELLRRTYDIPFVGVVPAVKPAAMISRRKSIGLFATNKTVSQMYTQKLISDFASDCIVEKFAMPEIVSFVENNIFTASKDEIIEKITPAAEFFRKSNVDTVILGCTHFVYLEEMFREVLGPDISVIDSREGVGRHAISLLSALPERNTDDLSDAFYVTSVAAMPENYKAISSNFGLAFGGEI